MRHLTMALLVCALPVQAASNDLPGCATAGSPTVMIEGQPALRLSDVAACPPALYDIIASIRIEGQPMVRFKSVKVGKMRCIPPTMLDTLAEEKPPSPDGEMACVEGN